MYQALYRKYRPLKFEDLVGQQHITSVLQNQLITGNISHAYLFSGTRGTGKTSAAKIFARAVNCLDNEDIPCNKCENCIESLEESAIDIIEIDAASNNGVDNIRDIKDRAFYQPASLKYKVYIIDEVHMLSKGAFNALLKILEEPPKHLIFILATTEPERIPLTILSRCQKFQFNRISPKVIEKRLEYIGEKEGITLDKKVLKLVTSKSDGSMRDALSIMDQLFTAGYDNIGYDEAIDILGIVNSRVLFDLVDALIDSSGDWIDILDQTLNSGKDIEQLSADILEHFRRLMIAKSSGESLHRYVYSDNDEYLQQSQKVSMDFILESMKIFIDNINKSRFSQQKRALLDIGILEILSINENTHRFTTKNISEDETKPEVVTREEKIEPIEKPIIEKNKESKVWAEDKILDKKETKVSTKDTKKTKSISALNIDQIKSDWVKILEVIRGLDNRLLHALVIEVTLIDFKDGMLELGFFPEYEFHKNRLAETSNMRDIEKAISMFYNEDIKIKLSTIEDIDEDAQKEIEEFSQLIGEDNVIIH